MPVLRTGGHSRRSRGCRNRDSKAWNAGYENGANGDERSLRRAVCVFQHLALDLPCYGSALLRLSSWEVLLIGPSLFVWREEGYVDDHF
jgi:hypothetical protein